MRRLLSLMAATAILAVLLPGAALAHNGNGDEHGDMLSKRTLLMFQERMEAQRLNAGPTAGGFTTDNVEYVKFVPFDQATSTGITIHKDIMFLTSWKNISTYDISDPLNPALLDQLQVGFMFENEDVEVTPDGKYMFFSESLPGDILRVYDVEDKTNIVEVAGVEGAGDHTSSCILKCRFMYGSDGSITDLRNPEKPKAIALAGDKGNWHEKIKLQGGGHDVTEVRNGFIIVSAIDEDPLLVDVRKPAKPKVIASGNSEAKKGEDRGYLWHSGEWPRNMKDRFLLMQGEQNFQPRCADDNGPFAAFDTRGWRSGKPFRLTDTFRVENGTYQDGSPAVNGLGCSAHWFEEHKTFRNGGLVTVAFYEHGTRFLDVSRKGKIKEKGYFLPYGGSTSASYWINKKIVYSVDYTRGLDILRFTGKTK